MSVPVEDQLRAYFTDLDREQGHVDPLTLSGATSSDPDHAMADPSTRGRRLDRAPGIELVVTPTPEEDTMKLKPATLLILAAAAVIVIVGVFFAIESGSDDSAPVVTDDVPAVTPEEFATGFIDSWSSGDASAVLSALTPDVAVSEKYTEMTRSFEPMEFEFFEQYVAWTTAQEAVFVEPECALTDDSTSAENVVTCEFGWLNAVERAADATPVPTVLTLVVTSDGISDLALEYPPLFGVNSFDSWLGANHGDESAGVEFGDWNSVAEARAGGLLRARYAEEWAAERDERLGRSETSDGESG